MANDTQLKLDLNIVGDARNLMAMVEKNTDVLEDSPIKSDNLSGIVSGKIGMQIALSGDEIPLKPTAHINGENLFFNKSEWSLDNMNVDFASFTLDKNAMTLITNNTLNAHPISLSWDHNRNASTTGKGKKHHH